MGFERSGQQCNKHSTAATQQHTQQHMSGQGRAGQGTAHLGKHSTAQHSAAQPSSAQHSTPAVSKPLRPARPAICSISLCSRAEWSTSRLRDRVEMMVVRAGMLIPAARVSVANTTFNNPATVGSVFGSFTRMHGHFKFSIAIACRGMRT